MERKPGTELPGGKSVEARSVGLSLLFFFLVILLSPFVYDLWVALQTSSGGG